MGVTCDVELNSEPATREQHPLDTAIECRQCGVLSDSRVHRPLRSSSSLKIRLNSELAKTFSSKVERVVHQVNQHLRALDSFTDSMQDTLFIDTAHDKAVVTSGLHNLAFDAQLIGSRPLLFAYPAARAQNRCDLYPFA